jgi:hypothetical protein
VSGQDDCPLTCSNDSECKPGDASFEGHPKDSQGNELDIHVQKNVDDYHCDCPEGFTGVDCAIAFESCADVNTAHVCYGGGTCIPGQQDEFGNEQYHCDCSNAIVEEKKFVGKYCEYKEENVCDHKEPTFCVNDGVCKSNPTQGEAPCTCKNKFAGVHCEYRKEEVPPCDLVCQNGGTCQIGTFDGELHYCLCPPGVHGDLCEKDDGASCGINTCYHGSECVQKDDGSLYCDCSASTTPGIHYAGRFCEYEATTYCGDTQDYYCVNDGECQDQGKGYVNVLQFVVCFFSPPLKIGTPHVVSSQHLPL